MIFHLKILRLRMRGAMPPFRHVTLPVAVIMRDKTMECKATHWTDKDDFGPMICDF